MDNFVKKLVVMKDDISKYEAQKSINNWNYIPLVIFVRYYTLKIQISYLAYIIINLKMICFPHLLGTHCHHQ